MAMSRYSTVVASLALAFTGLLAAATIGPSVLLSQEMHGEDRGRAPDFVGLANWMNSAPLTMPELEGKVVLVQFWTYTCINWQRTLPYVQKWYETYKDKGFVVIGVHAPEFSFEHDTANVEAAVKRFGLAYPVAQDNQFRTWRAYQNHYWPAAYLIDKSGKIVAMQFGEGNYNGMENAIARLVGANPPATKVEDPDWSVIGSPEMYFGAAKNDRPIVSSQSARAGERGYMAPASVPLNQFALSGTWKFSDENATLSADGGEIVIRFRAPKVNLIAGSPSPQTVSVTVDGKAQPPVTIEGSQLYTIYSGATGEHMLRLTIPKAGLSAFSLTFG
jgi:thiol-disulfide isomerase/thioredoxin